MPLEHAANVRERVSMSLDDARACSFTKKIFDTDTVFVWFF
jgi:hypothetical protein